MDSKKDQDLIYLYKAYWSKEKVLHIASKRYTQREGKNTTIRVYTTENEVSLYNNGKLIQTKKGNKVFEFKINMEEVNEIKVISGELSDSATIYKVKKANPDYKLKATDSKNWM